MFLWQLPLCPAPGWNHVFTDGSCLWQTHPAIGIASWNAVVACPFTSSWTFGVPGLVRQLSVLNFMPWPSHFTKLLLLVPVSMSGLTVLGSSTSFTSSPKGKGLVKLLNPSLAMETSGIGFYVLLSGWD